MASCASESVHCTNVDIVRRIAHPHFFINGMMQHGSRPLPSILSSIGINACSGNSDSSELTEPLAAHRRTAPDRGNAGESCRLNARTNHQIHGLSGDAPCSTLSLSIYSKQLSGFLAFLGCTSWCLKAGRCLTVRTTLRCVSVHVARWLRYLLGRLSAQSHAPYAAGLLTGGSLIGSKGRLYSLIQIQNHRSATISDPLRHPHRDPPLLPCIIPPSSVSLPQRALLLSSLYTPRHPDYSTYLGRRLHHPL
ncbi:hypothetical protein C8Q74DRAFT_919945 [Fomes fomentarius]|nr:hypothetical protein C8Q74DRAFT_919945 [Fomes fomentarius]